MAGKAKTDAGNTIVSLKITLHGTKPPIWRRLLVPAKMTLGDLHEVIQAAMGWEGGHMHAFDIGGKQYGERGALEDGNDENRLTLSAALKSGVDRFTYTYDFGDNWEHIVAIEKTLPALEGTAYPTCIAGKRACPPEDCGGIWGYYELLEILADPAHPERAERLEWLGRELDPEAFSVENADARLAAGFGRK